MDAALPHPVVAIDGPAASGKSSVAQAVARHLGFCFVSSGLFYRAAAAVACQMEAETVEELQPWLPEIGAFWQDGAMRPIWRGRPFTTEELTSPEINARVSAVAAWPEVRAWTLAQFRAFARQTPLVMEGRDIGSVVFPETPYKIFLEASPEVRASRRRAQGLDDSIAQRDRQDSTRPHAPLTVAEGALRLDNSHLTPEETVAAVLAALAQRGLTR